MQTLSLGLRERILASDDGGEGTRAEIAERCRGSLGMVKKLLQQRRHTGEIGARHHRSGRKPKILAAPHRQMRLRPGGQPDLALKELRSARELECSLPAIDYARAALGLTYKKDAPCQRTGETRQRASPPEVVPGAGRPRPRAARLP